MKYDSSTNGNLILFLNEKHGFESLLPQDTVESWSEKEPHGNIIVIPDLSSILANIGLTGNSAICIPRGSVSSPSSSIADKTKS